MDKNKIYNSLPSSWEDFRFEDYLKCIDIPIKEGEELTDDLDNTLAVIEAITGVSVKELEDLDMVTISAFANKLAFMKEMPKGGKSSIDWKKVEEITYNDFVSFATIQKDAVRGMGDIIKQFSKNGLTDEEINEMSVQEVHAGFFTLRKYLRKYMRRLTIRETMRLTKLSLSTLIRQRFRSRRSK